MPCCQCQGIEREFDAKLAGRELRQYHRRGPRKTTRYLVEALRQANPAGKTLLDIGGGIGVIQFELLEAGVRHVTAVDAASAYLQAAREEAARRGYPNRATYVYGDFVAVAPDVAPADIVTLDRVICCYPDVQALVDASAARSQAYYALVYPRDDWWMGVVRAAVNLVLRVRRSPMRFFLHPAREVDAAVRRHGFDLHVKRKTPLWHVAVYHLQTRVPLPASS